MKTCYQTHIRWMIRADLPSVLAIEQDTFDFPWSSSEFKIALSQPNTVGMVVERDGQILGYMIYELHKTKIVLLNFAIRSRSRRLGVGASMIERLKTKLGWSGRKRIVLEIAETNLDGQLFLREQSFKCISILDGWYSEQDCATAYRMEYRNG